MFLKKPVDRQSLHVNDKLLFVDADFPASSSLWRRWWKCCWWRCCWCDGDGGWRWGFIVDHGNGCDAGEMSARGVHRWLNDFRWRSVPDVYLRFPVFRRLSQLRQPLQPQNRTGMNILWTVHMELFVGANILRLFQYRHIYIHKDMHTQTHKYIYAHMHIRIHTSNTQQTHKLIRKHANAHNT